MHLRPLRPLCANPSSSHHPVLSYPLVKLRCGRPLMRNRRTNYSPRLSFTRGHLTKRKFMYVKARRSRFWVFGGVGTQADFPARQRTGSNGVASVLLLQT
jgi:hypothetical protein